MLLKTSTLSGHQLDYAVGVSLDLENIIYDKNNQCWGYYLNTMFVSFQPQKNWDLAGVIIENQKLGVRYSLEPHGRELWEAQTSSRVKGQQYCFARGKTPLIAALRCFVNLKVGKTIEMPEDISY